MSVKPDVSNPSALITLDKKISLPLFQERPGKEGTQLQTTIPLPTSQNTVYIEYKCKFLPLSVVGAFLPHLIVKIIIKFSVSYLLDALSSLLKQGVVYLKKNPKPLYIPM